jgi:hypothetical protein
MHCPMEEVCGFHKSQIMPHDSLICVLCPGSFLTLFRTSCRKYFGYQNIFHTDNGKEFTDIVVTKALREMNPHIYTVTGHPSRPFDQGSVESMNKLVKRILGTLLTEHRLAGDNPNWTEVLGMVAATINSQHGRGKDVVSLFDVVYGQVLNHGMSCSKAEVRQC